MHLYGAPYQPATVESLQLPYKRSSRYAPRTATIPQSAVARQRARARAVSLPISFSRRMLRHKLDVKFSHLTSEDM